jgi:hypothetical protein
MAALVIPSQPPFGGMTNQTISRLVDLNSTLPRLQEAIATAASGYEGIGGTEYEAPLPVTNGTLPRNIPFVPVNNFGVQPDPANPGANGTAYAYAVGVLATAWTNFWLAAGPSIQQLDNGSRTL